MECLFIKIIMRQKGGNRIDYPFEYEIPDIEEFKMLREYLKKMLDVSKDESKKSYSLSSEMFEHIRNRYVH